MGIWRRESIELTGAPDLPEGPFEAADVVWFQGRTRYADLRLPQGPAAPFSEEEAFGGRQRWDAPRLQFLHDLDRSGRLAEDAGDLELVPDPAGDLLLETGSFVHDGQPCRYLERWRRATPPTPDVRVHELRSADGGLAGLCLHIHDQRLLLRRITGEVRARHTHVETGRTIGSLGDPGAPPGQGADPWRCLEGPA